MRENERTYVERDGNRSSVEKSTQEEDGGLEGIRGEE